MKEKLMCSHNIIHSKKIEKYQNNCLDDDVLNDLTYFFKLLGDSTRMKILYLLDKEEMCVCDIANLLGMTKSSISHQLANLREAKIVKYRKEGINVYYSLDDEHVSQVFELGLEHIIHQRKDKKYEKSI